MKHQLDRRGYSLGVIETGRFGAADPAANWQQGKPVFVPGICAPMLAQQQHNIIRSGALYQALLDQQDLDRLLAADSFQAALQGRFEVLGSLVHEGEEQELETVFFDALSAGQVVAEDLWMKVSWLSFDERDASMRFRFSFGTDHVEDVAGDPSRQHYAALLTDAIFPESVLITENRPLAEILQDCVDGTPRAFVERIVYFNAPQGGAYLHHDRERGHAGVIYAQVTGSTFWLALSRQCLLHELGSFLSARVADGDWPVTLDAQAQLQLSALAGNQRQLAEELESLANDALIHLTNETEAFVQQLINAGHGRLLRSGDVLLLPQQSAQKCCWHSVFCLGDDSGQALSFAIRSS